MSTESCKAFADSAEGLLLMSVAFVSRRAFDVFSFFRSFGKLYATNLLSSICHNKILHSWRTHFLGISTVIFVLEMHIFWLSCNHTAGFLMKHTTWGETLFFTSTEHQPIGSLSVQNKMGEAVNEVPANITNACSANLFNYNTNYTLANKLPPF